MKGIEERFCMRMVRNLDAECLSMSSDGWVKKEDSGAVLLFGNRLAVSKE